MTPYYQDEAAGIVIYHGDNRKIAPLLGEFDLLLTDPPYGIGADSNMARNKGKWGFRDHGQTDWDTSPPPVWFLQMVMTACQKQIIWGGNYFGLPKAQCWLVWNKMQRDFDFADAELAWTNLEKAVRVMDYSRGALLAEGKVHPTQKPLNLMSWCLSHAPEAKTVFDPWMGSGTTLVAAKLRGLRAIGIEANEEYCEAAVRRLAQEVLAL